MWLYILASQKNGTLYVGVTNSLSRRMSEHKDGHGSQFVRQYGVKRLVYAEHFIHPADAFAQEKRVKHWHRQWKVDLIERAHPDWRDLYPTTHLD